MSVDGPDTTPYCFPTLNRLSSGGESVVSDGKGTFTVVLTDRTLTLSAEEMYLLSVELCKIARRFGGYTHH